jgi:ribosomal protein S18 acetylase RimI-like enzyme
MNSTPENPPPPVTLRPERPEDEPFLYTVYASTREEELALTQWDAAARRTFLDHQFRAMRQGYRGMFPEGEFLIIEIGGQAAGRMVMHRTAAEIRVVDLALLPPYRNRGIGTGLMGRICAGADRPVRLSVLRGNRALGWYGRLGFSKISELGIYEELEWHPPESLF